MPTEKLTVSIRGMSYPIETEGGTLVHVFRTHDGRYVDQRHDVSYAAVLIGLSGLAALRESFIGADGNLWTKPVLKRGLVLLPGGHDPPRYRVAHPLPLGVVALGPTPTVFGHRDEIASLMGDAFEASIPERFVLDLHRQGKLEAIAGVIGAAAARARIEGMTRMGLREFDRRYAR